MTLVHKKTQKPKPIPKDPSSLIGTSHISFSHLCWQKISYFISCQP